MLKELRDRLKALLEERATIAATAVDEKRGMTDEEKTLRASKSAEIEALEERIAELEDQEKRESAAAQHHRDAGTAETEERAKQTTEVREPEMYTKNGPNSYFGDLFRSVKHQDIAASERLRRHAVHMSETRALGNTNAAGGSGGEWAPPTWVTDEWVNLIRPARVTANLFKHKDVPFGTSSLNYPKLLTGTSVGLQSTQSSALASTDPTTGFIQVGFSTLGGKNVLSQQIIDQSINFDDVVLEDLAAAYAQQVGTQVFTGTGTGSGTNAVINGLGSATIGSTQTWTQASPTPGGFYGQTGALLSQFLAKRLAAPTHWVMSPRRWFWMESALDNNGRPYVVPTGNAYNPLAVEQGVVAAGMVGTMHGLPVVIDPLVPTNLGAGTNQDIVYLIKADDLVLLESPPKTEVFRETYADSLGVLVRLYAYVATVLNRHPESIGSLSGTGLVTPTFAS